MRVARSLAAAVAALVLAGCTSDAGDEPAPTPTSILAAHGLDGLDARQVIDRLDRMPVDARPHDLLASVGTTQLELTDTRTKATTALDLPADQFYVSMAPYVDTTHDCFYHSLTTCRGELSNKEMKVSITDRTSGQVIVDGSATTFDNGFVGFWLPFGIQATVRVEYDGRTASADLSTAKDAPTCVTTLHLTPAKG